MDIRVKIGRRAGEICDIAPEAARSMLADGRAERAYPDQLPQFACGGEVPPGPAPLLAAIEEPHHALLRRHLKKAGK